MSLRDVPPRELETLSRVLSLLNQAATLNEIMAIVRRAARQLTGAQGATFILRDGDHCHYADEDAISPLWKGRRFQMENCVSGWAMRNTSTVVIEDIYADPRVPWEAYHPTFIKSLAIAPIRRASPVGAIGIYWAMRHAATPGELETIEALAEAASAALAELPEK